MTDDFDPDTYVRLTSPDEPGSPLTLEGYLSSTFRNHIHFGVLREYSAPKLSFIKITYIL